MRAAAKDPRKWLAGMVVTAALVGGGAVAAGAVTAGAGAPGAGPVSEAVGADADPVSSVPPEQSAAIAELRRARTSDDALPPRWQALLTDGGDHWGANPDLSRRTAPGVWLVPGRGYTCLASATPDDGGLGFGCARPADVRNGLLSPSDLDAGGDGVLTGVVPDGVTSVALVDRDGSSRTADVDRNTYRAAIDSDLEEVRFTDASGGVRVLPMGWSR